MAFQRISNRGEALFTLNNKSILCTLLEQNKQIQVYNKWQEDTGEYLSFYTRQIKNIEKLESEIVN